MSALEEGPLHVVPAPDVACEAYRRGQPPCGSTKALRRLFVGWRCSDCALSGAQIYEYAVAPAGDRPELRVVPDLPEDAGRWDVAGPSRLPDPARPGAQLQAEPTATAAQAAALAWGKSGKPRRRLLEQFIAVGAEGMTSWEAWSWYRATHGEIDLYSLRPRLTELKKDGWIRDSGRRRHPRGHGDAAAPAEEVLVLTERGRAEAAATTGGSR